MTGRRRKVLIFFIAVYFHKLGGMLQWGVFENVTSDSSSKALCLCSLHSKNSLFNSSSFVWFLLLSLLLLFVNSPSSPTFLFTFPVFASLTYKTTNIEYVSAPPASVLGNDAAVPCAVVKTVDSFSFLHHPVHQRSLEILQRCKDEKYSK